MIVSVRFRGRDPWSGVVGKFKSCKEYIRPHFTRSGTIYTGLNKEQEAELEIELGYEPGTLSKNSKFWDTFVVTIGSDGLNLDTENPNDKLTYFFLKGNYKVASSVTDNRPGVRLIMTNMEDEAKQKNIINNKKADAIIALKKMSIDEKRKALRILGFKTENISDEVIDAKMFDITEKDPDRFFEKWVKNSSREIEYMIEEAISKNILRRSKNLYYYGTDIIGHSFEDTIAFFLNSKNNDIKLTVLDEINAKK